MSTFPAVLPGPPPPRTRCGSRRFSNSRSLCAGARGEDQLEYPRASPAGAGCGPFHCFTLIGNSLPLVLRSIDPAMPGWTPQQMDSHSQEPGEANLSITRFGFVRSSAGPIVQGLLQFGIPALMQELDLRQAAGGPVLFLCMPFGKCI